MADRKLDKEIADGKKRMAELGRSQSAATGQNYQELDEVPLSEEAIETAQAIEEASAEREPDAKK